MNNPAAKGEVCVRLKDVQKQYGDKVVLGNVSLEVKYGETVAIMGTSGSGKSTLLNILAALDKADSGEYYFADKSVKGFKNGEKRKQMGTTELWRSMGFVFQTPFMLDNFDVAFNVELSYFASGRAFGDQRFGTLRPFDPFKKKMRREGVRRALSRVGLKNELQDKLASEISGGQRQRVAIARAVYHNPNLILADEPTGSLDVENAKVVADLLRKHAVKEDGSRSAVIVVTHDPRIAIKFDRVYVLEKDGSGAPGRKLGEPIPLPDGLDAVESLNPAQQTIYQQDIELALKKNMEDDANDDAS